MNGPTIHRTSPQIAQPATISSTMLDVIIALVPALAMAVFLFGIRVLALTAVSVGTCVLAEYGYRRLRGQSNTIGDLSACVTGLLLAMSLPVTAPYWAPVLGGLFAIVIVKQFYGGLGRNFLNPALAGRTLLCTFPGLMTSWVDAFQRPGLIQGVDAASSATPMAVLHTGAVPDLTLGQMLLGQHGGAMGGVPVLMLLLGGLYLVSRRVITPRIPLAYLGTVALLTLLFPRGDEGALAWMTAQLCCGGLVMGAVFMASDYTTTPVTPLGQTIFGVGCGVLTVLLRYFGSYPDGVGWAILTMNCCVWLMDRAAIPRRFGMGRFALVRSWGQQLKESLAAIHFVPPKLKFLARAGDGTMPGEGYLDELKGKVRQWAALGGVLTVLLRYFGSYPDGVGWAILTMNCCVWLMDRAAIPRRFGMGRFALVRSWGQQLKESLSAIHFVPPKLKFLARAGDGTMPGEGYLDELKGKVRQWAALGGVLLAVCLMIFGVHRATDYAAVRAETEAQAALLDQVMPQATMRTETPYYASGALSITAGYNDSGLVGYCVEVQAHGFGGLMTAVVGVNTNGEVTGVAVTSHQETEGVGTDAMTQEYLDQYVGKSGTIRTAGNNSVDAASGATATSEAVTACVNQALAIVANLDTEGGVDYVDGEV